MPGGISEVQTLYFYDPEQDLALSSLLLRLLVSFTLQGQPDIQRDALRVFAAERRHLFSCLALSVPATGRQTVPWYYVVAYRI